MGNEDFGVVQQRRGPVEEVAAADAERPISPAAAAEEAEAAVEKTEERARPGQLELRTGLVHSQDVHQLGHCGVRQVHVEPEHH